MNADPNQPSPHRSDLTLLARLRRGEGEAATDLYLRYAQRLHGLATRQTSAELAVCFDPDDIVQSVFRTFFRRFDSGDYQVPEGKELWGLLLVIALNKIREAAIYHRAARRDLRRTTSLDTHQWELGSPSHQKNEETALSILQMVIDDVVESLPEVKRQMIRLRIEGHEIEEIARITARSKRTVERTLQEFRRSLGAIIGRPDTEGPETRDEPV